jgi:uncharacterized membrane protein YfcA
VTLAVTLTAAVFVGLVVGLLGGGGSILTVPALVYLAGLPPKPAIAASLLVVGVTSLTGLAVHARAGRVRWRTGFSFGVAGMAGAYGGGRLAGYLPATLLLVGFGLTMAVTAVAMLRPRRPTAPEEPGPASPGRAPRLPVIIAQGLAVGAVTGLVGAGGGFVIVPALVILGGLTMPQAVGTSLLVLTMQSFAGFAGHLANSKIDWALARAFTAVAVVGALVGSGLSGRINAAALRKGFGWFVIVMAIVVLTLQLPQGWRDALTPG